MPRILALATVAALAFALAPLVSVPVAADNLSDVCTNVHADNPVPHTPGSACMAKGENPAPHATSPDDLKPSNVNDIAKSGQSGGEKAGQ